MLQRTTPGQLALAIDHLAAADSTLASVMTAVGPCRLGRRHPNLFDSLAGSIISQQLSEKASSAIESRIARQCQLERPFQPEEVLTVSVERLREAGLSTAKATYIRNLAELIRAGTLRLEDLRDEPDEVVTERLMELPGIGKWTAEMFLIFGLGRLDVLSTGDAGLCRAVRLLYGYKVGPTEDQFIKLAKRWRPYRSVASWYLWRSLD